MQLLLLKYSFSSSFKCNGELTDWEGGKFLNKQTLREDLSQAKQWKEPDSKVPCERGGCYTPRPIGTRTWPQGSWGWRTRRVGLLHPQPVFQPHWCDCEFWLDALLGSTARGESVGANQTSWDTGMGPQLWKGGRISCQATYHEQGSPEP